MIFRAVFGVPNQIETGIVALMKRDFACILMASSSMRWFCILSPILREAYSATTPTWEA